MKGYKNDNKKDEADDAKGVHMKVCVAVVYHRRICLSIFLRLSVSYSPFFFLILPTNVFFLISWLSVFQMR